MIDEIAKIALVILNCNDLINCNELNLEEKVKIRIANSDIVQKMISKFKEEFPGFESWIDVTIDLLDVKKIMKSYKNKQLVKELDEQMKQRRNMLNIYRIKNKIDYQDNKIRAESEQEIDKVMKRIKLSNLKDDDKTDNIDSLVDLVTENKASNLANKTNDNLNLKVKPSKDSNNIMDIIKTKLDDKESSDEKSSDENSETIDQQIESEGDSEDEEIENNGSNETEEEFENEEEAESQKDDQEDNESETDELDVDIEVDENYNSSSDSKPTEKPKEIKSSESPVDIRKASEDYLKRQFVKAFGEKIANRPSNKDVSSDEEWDDDFFINKKVKKFKPTQVDLERYKDLELKEKGGQEDNEDDEENDDDEPIYTI